MAGRQCCRGNGSGTVGGALAAAAVGSAIAAGTAGGKGVGRTAGSASVEEQESCAQNMQQENIPMCRHINPISTTTGCCSVEKQLWELNQVLDYQNKILVELLQAVRERF